jgi:hypothetical protein
MAAIPTRIFFLIPLDHPLNHDPNRSLKLVGVLTLKAIEIIFQIALAI